LKYSKNFNLENYRTDFEQIPYTELFDAYGCGKDTAEAKGVHREVESEVGLGKTLVYFIRD
jgi:hypothetical protein